MHQSDCLVVGGLGGAKTLKGSIDIGMSKNAILPVFGIAFLSKTPVTFDCIEYYSDIDNILKILEELGAVIERKGSSATIDTRSIKVIKPLNKEYSSSLRASIALTGPILARFGQVEFSKPGGCKIGERPIDFFLSIYRLMGAKVVELEESVKVSAPNGLKKVEYEFPFPSVLGVITGAITAALAEGKSVFKNCPIEPEVTHILEYLKMNGFEVEGIGTSTISVTGDRTLRNIKIAYKNMPDRIQTASYLLLSLMNSQEMLLNNCANSQNEAVFQWLRTCGVTNFEVFQDKIQIGKQTQTIQEKSIVVSTEIYPGISTDIQTMCSVFLTQIPGTHTIMENIFEGRIEKQLAEISKFGVSCDIQSHKMASIKGGVELVGANVESVDFRCAFALLAAGLSASGTTRISSAFLLDRGYNNIVEKITSLGGIIERKNVVF